MKPNTKSETSTMIGKHTPKARDGESLQWLVVNPEGKLLAVLDSESEAFHYTHNRGHANGAVYFKAACDYSAAPQLLEALRAMVAIHGPVATVSESVKALNQARAAIARAEGRVS